MEPPIKMDDLGVPPVKETTISSPTYTLNNQPGAPLTFHGPHISLP